MSFDIRPAQADEMDQLGLMGAYSYAGAFGDGPDNVVRNSQRPEWTLCAFDGSTMATSFAAFPFTIRANGKSLAYAGITAVGTRPEYRRRGLLRKIMTRAFADQRERGQSVAGLWASQAAIYQRYGFAALGAMRAYRVDTVDLQFHDGDTGTLDVRRYPAPEALDAAKTVYRQFIEPRFGYLHRAQVMWRDTVMDETEESGPIWAAVAHDDSGAPRGYVLSTLRADKVAHAARSQEITVRDLAWLDANAYRSLWAYLAQHDLVGRIAWDSAPVDDPLPELVAEPRMLHHRDGEGSWFRVVDLAAAVTQRGYSTTGEVTIELTPDTLTPWNDGIWHIAVSPETAEAKQVQTEPRVRMNSRTLSALYSGTRKASDLHHWGLIAGERAAVDALDRMFRTEHAPHCPDHY